MSNTGQLRNVTVPGGNAQARPLRKLEIDLRLFANTDQIVPVRVIHGRDRIAGLHIFPIFAMRSEDVKTDTGGK